MGSYNALKLGFRSHPFFFSLSYFYEWRMKFVDEIYCGNQLNPKWTRQTCTYFVDSTEEMRITNQCKMLCLFEFAWYIAVDECEMLGLLNVIYNLDEKIVKSYFAGKKHKFLCPIGPINNPYISNAA